MFDFVHDIIVGQDLSMGDRMLTTVYDKRTLYKYIKYLGTFKMRLTFQCELCLFSYTGGTTGGDCRLGFPVSQLQTEGGPSREFNCVSCWSFVTISWSH